MNLGNPDHTSLPSPTAAGCTGVDLSYLHPDRIRIGGTGVFAGDWAWTNPDNGEPRIPVGFVGVLVDWWNGFAVFGCTREVAEAIVADQEHRRETERLRYAGELQSDDDLRQALDELWTPMYFDGDEIVVDERATYGEEGLSRIAPDDDGRYIVNGWRWTWQAVHPASCDRIVGKVPPPGQHQEYVLLTHTGMRVPHDRVRVAGLRHHPTGNGVALTALVHLDDTLVGTIRNSGDGGPTEYHCASSSAFNALHLQQYVAACRLRGASCATADVLEALVHEHEMSTVINGGVGQGAAVVRLLDKHGDELATLTAAPAPSDRFERDALVHRVRTEHQDADGVLWQIWSGSGWKHLCTAAPLTQPRHPLRDTKPNRD
ncbi:MAG TPA: hypothetical protein VF755_11125 [Catenuloplanes sp.]|jgi:hypothetical protein